MLKKSIEALENELNKYKNSVTNPIIYNILEWFVEFFRLFFSENKHTKVFKRGDTYLVNLGINIGSELNKRRPCVVVSSDRVNRGDCLVVLPLKTLKKDIFNEYSLVVDPVDNGLVLKSYINVTDLRSISKKRISKYIGKLSLKDLDLISNRLFKYLVKQKSAN